MHYDVEVAMKCIQRFGSLLLGIALAAAGPSCMLTKYFPDGTDKVCVDFLEAAGFEANALAPQVLCADSARNRVFAACANSSAVAVIDCATGRADQIPVDSRMPRRLREGGMCVSSKTGRLYLCGAKRLIVVDPDAGTARSVALPADFETIVLYEEKGCAYLAGRESGALAVVETDGDRVRLIPFGEPAPLLPFMAASAPPPIRSVFMDPGSGRIHILDGHTASLITIDTRKEKVIATRKLTMDAFPRWHIAGFDPAKGLIYGAVEDEQRRARHAFAIDMRGDADVIVDLPEKHTEPAGVRCDVERGELYIPYDNMKVIHAVTFEEGGRVVPIDLPALGVNATSYDPAAHILYAAGWNQAALYIVDIESRKVAFTVPYFPVYPHMNCMVFNRGDGKLYVPSGSTAVNGTFGASISVFDPASFGFSTIQTGWAPVDLVQKPGSESFYVFSTEQSFAEVAPDGTCVFHTLPHPYLRQAIAGKDGKSVRVAYGPHASMWPNFYIGGTRNGIYTLEGDGEVVEDRMTPRLAQGMVLDRQGMLWILQNTWGREAPFLIGYPEGEESWFRLELPPAVDNECLLRLLTVDERSGFLYVVRAGDRNTDPGRLYAVDPKKREIAASIEVGRTPTGICTLPEKGRICISNFDDDTVSLVDTETFEVRSEPVGSKPIAVRAHRDSGVIYVLNHLGNSLTILGEEKQTLPFEKGTLPDNLLVDPLSGCVFITAHSATEGRVYQYYPEGEEIRTLATWEFPFGETTFDRTNAAFGLRGQWGDGIFRISKMVLDAWGRLWVTDYLGGRLMILQVR